MATREEIEAEELAALRRPDPVLRSPGMGRVVESEPVTQSDISEALAALDLADDSKGIALAMRKVVATRLLRMIGENKVAAGDLIKLHDQIANRVDGKVADKHEVSGAVLLKSMLSDIDGMTAGLPKDDVKYRPIDAEYVNVSDSTRSQGVAKAKRLTAGNSAAEDVV